MALTQGQPRFCKLIMVTENNNNKWYQMEWNGVSPNFDVKYGRVESTSVTTSYPVSDWDKKYNEKVKKGYKDVTHTVAVKTEDPKPTSAAVAKTGDSLVDSFLEKMKRYTDGLVAKTYSVTFNSVTQSQIDEAQKYINDLNALASKKKRDEKAINATLLNLYTVIPRYMSDVRGHLLPNIKLEKILDEEQDNLDAMASQVKMYKPSKEKKKTQKSENLLQIMGITMKESKNNQDIDYLLKQAKNGKKVKAIFEVVKPAEDKVFDTWLKSQKDKSTKTLIHGTRCSSVIPILEIGLKIRPKGNFQFSGKVYGDGNYFSEVVTKSLNYTGYDNDSILLVYEVHTGNPYVYNGWYNGNAFPLNYQELQKRGFDSTYVKAGNGLLNSEIIAYKEEQCRIKKIIWLEN